MAEENFFEKKIRVAAEHEAKMDKSMWKAWAGAVDIWMKKNPDNEIRLTADSR